MFLSTLLTSAMLIAASPSCEVTSISSSSEMIASAQNVVFRSTQKLRSKDGREIYFYSSGKCEGYDGDRLMFSTKYFIQGNEVRLLDENGNTLYKGTIRWSVQGQSIYSLSLAGTVYYR